MVIAKLIILLSFLSFSQHEYYENTPPSEGDVYESCIIINLGECNQKYGECILSYSEEECQENVLFDCLEELGRFCEKFKKKEA